MLKLVLLVLFALTSVYAEGEFVILHSPKSLQFQGKTPLPQSVLKDVFFSVLGYSSKIYENPWDGLSTKNIFKLPEALVSVAIESNESFSSHPEVRYPLQADEDEETTWQAISTRLHGRNNNITLVRINANDGLDVLGHSVLFGEIKTKNIDSLKHLNEKNIVDKKFIEEVQVLRGIAEKVDTTVIVDAKSDVYWFVVSGLNEIMKAYSKNSPVYHEAVEVLNDAIDELSGAFKNAYNGNVFIATFTNDADKTTKNIRVRRADTPRQESTTTPKPDKPNEDNEEEDEKKEDEKNGKQNEESENDDKIIEVNETTTEKYNENINMVLSTSKPEIKSMTGKENTKEKLPIKASDLNLATRYTADYPIIFNIFLWFGVAFIFALLAICIAIAEMDPGRDSIIYRMTSNRMKKDN